MAKIKMNSPKAGLKKRDMHAVSPGVTYVWDETTKEIVVRIPIRKPALEYEVSKSGKSRLLGGTYGFRRVEGAPHGKVTVNAIAILGIPKDQRAKVDDKYKKLAGGAKALAEKTAAVAKRGKS